MPALKPRASWSDLSSRVASGLLMALAALASAWFGGPIFALFWMVAALAVLAEWLAMVTGAWAVAPPLFVGFVAIVAAVLLAHLGYTLASAAAALAGLAIVFLLLRGRPHATLAALGVPYAAATAVPAVILRADPLEGGLAIAFLFAVVWGTDIMAYFTGRTLGGPKLWPAVSPKKTWSGFLGGTFFGAGAGVGVAFVAGLTELPVIFGIGVALAVISQGGDLLESSLKRQFGVKDASRLIPGHGGVMDRLDGFIAAGLLAVVIGLLRDPLLPAAGLLHW